MKHPDIEDEPYDRSDYIRVNGVLVERDYMDWIDSTERRAMRRASTDYPFDEDEPDDERD